jgi:hypothetical protein
LNPKTIFKTLESSFVALETEFDALKSIFEVGFVFFGVFRLGLAGNEEHRRRWYGRRWWVTARLAVAGECHRWRGEGDEEEEEKKKKTGACVGVLFSF